MHTIFKKSLTSPTASPPRLTTHLTKRLTFKMPSKSQQPHHPPHHPPHLKELPTPPNKAAHPTVTTSNKDARSGRMGGGERTRAAAQRVPRSARTGKAFEASPADGQAPWRCQSRCAVRQCADPRAACELVAGGTTAERGKESGMIGGGWGSSQVSKSAVKVGKIRIRVWVRAG